MPYSTSYPVIIKNGNRPKKIYIPFDSNYTKQSHFDAHKRKEKKQEPIRCYCYPKNSRFTKDALQMIIYPNSICIIGIDAWRSLDKHDCSSYKTLKMTLDEADKKYDIIFQKGEKKWIT